MKLSYQLLDPSYREHVMLLCNSQSECDSAAVDSINEGLEGGQLCIYASVLNGDESHLAMVSARIHGYQDRVESGDLVIVDFKPFYDSALSSNLGPFVALKEQIEGLLRRRISEGKGDKVLIFAEAAGALSERRQFDKSMDLERWWNDVHAEWIRNDLNITVICPHPGAILKEESAPRAGIAHAHTMTFELEQLRRKPGQEIRVLVAEPEKELQSLYRLYLGSLSGVMPVVVDSGKKCLDHALSDAEGGFDLIIVDTSLADGNAAELARRIKKAVPGQRIVFTTTSVDAEAERDAELADEVLVKPFRISLLLSVIRPK